jgi:hypothetical protein
MQAVSSSQGSEERALPPDDDVELSARIAALEALLRDRRERLPLRASRALWH